jgi:hypothetical protein
LMTTKILIFLPIPYTYPLSDCDISLLVPDPEHRKALA